jgi:2-oxo-4-hydroxy-4-carboxy-5-ureidoimidazoline decarboxylase
MNPMPHDPITMDEINALSHGEFIARLGWIFEHSPWVAERAWAKRPFTSEDHLHAAMMETVEQAAHPDQLALLRAHPDLGARARVGVTGAVGLSAASAAEQKDAGLDRLTITEHEHLMKLNTVYRKKFGFPFLYAVRGAKHHDILKALEQRLTHADEDEFQEALKQVYRIARFRLESVISR